MKKIKQLIAALFIVISFCGSVYSQALSVSTLSYIDSLINSNYPANGTGLSLIIAKGGMPLYKKAYGMADLELNVPMNTSNIFSIGSMTKQFTAVAILQLANDRKLNITDDIKTFLPEYNSHGRTITIENCMSHTSGIPSFTELKGFDTIYQKKMTKVQMMEYFQNADLMFEPGTDFSYSNSGFYLLGAIIEKVSGISYEDYIQKNIFDKAGMKHSYFESDINIIPMRASGYDGVDSSNYKNASYYERSWAMAAGNIMSCTEDLMKWDAALYTDKIVPRDLLKRAWIPFKIKNGQTSNYGYGWNVTRLGDYTVIKHGGAINGYLTDGVRVPEEHLYIAALSNSTGKSPDDITTKILMKILNVSESKPPVLSLDKNSFKQFIGVYEVNREGARLLKNFSEDKQYRYVFVDNDSLMLQRTGGDKIALLEYDKDKFYVKDSPRRFEFKRDSEGKIDAIEVFSYPINFGPNDICMKTEGVAMIGEKKEVKISEDVFKAYVGEFELEPGFILTITIEDGKLMTQPTGQDKIELHPESETEYFIKEVDAQVEFVADADGTVNKLILTQGRKFECKRVNN